MTDNIEQDKPRMQLYSLGECMNAISLHYGGPLKLTMTKPNVVTSGALVGFQSDGKLLAVGRLYLCHNLSVQTIENNTGLYVDVMIAELMFEDALQ